MFYSDLVRFQNAAYFDVNLRLWGIGLRGNDKRRGSSCGHTRNIIINERRNKEFLSSCKFGCGNRFLLISGIVVVVVLKIFATFNRS